MRNNLWVRFRYLNPYYTVRAAAGLGLVLILTVAGSANLDANSDFVRGSGGEGFVTLGDSRIVWVAPTTNDYFIRIKHEQVLTGRGHYVFHLASSQLGTTDTGRLQTGRRDLTLFNGGELVFDGTVEGGIGIFNWDYPNNNAGIGYFVSTVFFLDNEVGS